MFTIGVEEEYQLVDATTRALKPRGSRVLHALPDDVEMQASVLFSVGIPQSAIKGADYVDEKSNGDCAVL